MKKCAYINDNHIERYVLNLLSDEEEFEFQKHLLECDECFSKLESVRRLAESLSEKEVKKEPILRKYFSIAATIIILIGIGAYFGGVFISEKQPELIALLPEETIIENKIDTIITETEEPVLQKDFLANINDKPVLETKTNVRKKENSETEKKQDETNGQWGIHQEPNTASFDSMGIFELPGTAASSQKISFKILKPEAETTVSIKNYTTNIFEFRWQVKEPTLSILLITDGKDMLGKFNIENEDNIKIDLSKYSKHEEIRWVLMVGSIDNKAQGKIILEK